MINLYITRHGETEWNIEKRMQGWMDSPLTKLGINQAKWLGERLKSIDFEAIYASPSGRTFETAQLIKGQKNIEIKKDDDLREINLGDWEGKNISEIEAIDKDQLNKFWKAPHLYKRNSGESFDDVMYRAQSIIKKVLVNHKEGNILLVTHTVLLKAIMSQINGTEIEKIWEPPFINQTSLSLVTMENDKYNILLHGDTSHYRDFE